MEEKVDQFKEYWSRNKSFMSLELEDYEIVDFIERAGTIERAVDLASDYQLANGIGEVEE